MREAAVLRLPKFTAVQTQLLKRSSAFFCLNHYNTTLVLGRNKVYVGPAAKMDNVGKVVGQSYDNEKDVTTTTDPTWSTTAMWWNIIPHSLSRLVQYLYCALNLPVRIMVTYNSSPCGNRRLRSQWKMRRLSKSGLGFTASISPSCRRK